MNGAKKFFLLLLYAVHLPPGASSLVARDEVSEQEAAEAVEAFHKMDEWAVGEFQLPHGDAAMPELRLDGNHADSFSALIKAKMEHHVGPLPDGTTFMYDGGSYTLAVRSTNEALQRIQYYCEKAVSKALNFKLEVFESSSGSDFQFHEALLTEHNHSAHAQRLRELSDKGEVKLIGMIQWMGRSGQRTKTTYTNTEKGSRLVVEMDPVLGGEKYVDVNLHLEHVSLASGEDQVPATAAEASLATALTLRCGRARVVGLWKPRGAAREVTRTAILTVDAVPLLPERNRQLADRLRAEEVDDVKRGQVKTSNPGRTPVPQGMEQRQIVFGFDLYQLWQVYEIPSGQVTDPFKDQSESDTTKTAPFRTGPVRDIIKQQGIHLPEGSKIYYHHPTSTLVVLSTPEAIDAVQGFLDSISFDAPVFLRSAVKVVEGEAAQIRSLIASTQGLTDHTTAWKQMDAMVAKGDLLQTALLITETRSGQKMTMFSGEVMGDDPNIDAQDEEEVDEPTGPGTRLSLDPVIGPNGYDLDMDLHLEHHEWLPNAKQTVTPPAHSVQTSIATVSGRPVLLGVWSPAEMQTGNPILRAAFIKVNIVRMDR